MLVLSRKKNQTIVIEGGIEIEVLQLKGGTVKIGIRAPEDIRIIRGELDMFSDMIPMEESIAKSDDSEAAVVEESRLPYQIRTVGPLSNRLVAK